MSQEYLNQKELARQRNQEKKKKVVDEIENSKPNEATQDKDNSQVTILSYFIVTIAIVADLFGLIPIAGNFLGLVFGIILTILYFFDGIGKKISSQTRRWLLRAVLYLTEVLALGFSWLPLFTIEALINYYLSKKGSCVAIKKIEKITNKFEKN